MRPRSASPPRTGRAGRVAATVRRRVEAGGDRIWRLADFNDLPSSAVVRALSRLTAAGELQRLSKGVYHRGTQTALGKSRPNPAAVQRLAAGHAAMFPAGAAAANLLGLTTQVSGRPEIATIAPSLPRNLVGKEAIVHTRRPPAWSNLSAEDAALLDLLRRGGSTCELSPADAIERVLALLSEPGRFRTLASVARSEPPRVRALLGALGERIGARAGLLKPIRESLNPLSRFDFGIFSALPNARSWQARQPRPRETPPPPRL